MSVTRQWTRGSAPTWGWLAGLAIALLGSDSLAGQTTSPAASTSFTLTNVSVIDGTGAPVKRDQAVVVQNGRISAVGPASEIQPMGERRDLRGHTVIPGLVGMHNHLFYGDGGRRYVSLPRSFAHLYLAHGVTTVRTAGTVDLGADIEMKRAIDEGREVGPTIHLTSPYLEHDTDAAAAVQAVNSWADAGVTSIKAYTSLRRDELAAAIKTAHRRGLKVAGHLCAVGFREAAELGIDSLEHGLLADSEFYSRKSPDECPDWQAVLLGLADMTVKSPEIEATIRQLVEHRVAVTSTLAVFESFTSRADLDAGRMSLLLNGVALRNYDRERAVRRTQPEQFEAWDRLLALEMAFERAFVAAGGLLMSGADPTGWGGTVAGLADRRNLELLVAAGFAVETAVQIATANGARSLGVLDDVGEIVTGKRADLVVIEGDLASDVQKIRWIKTVIKHGVSFDPAPLISAEYGKVGPSSFWFWAALAAGPVLVLLLLAFKAVRRK